MRILLILFLGLIPTIHAESCQLSLTGTSAEPLPLKESAPILQRLAANDSDEAEFLNNTPAENVELYHWDLNNDGKKEYIAATVGGTGHFYYWSAYNPKTAEPVPSTFYGQEELIQNQLFAINNTPFGSTSFLRSCGKNYVLNSYQDGTQNLFLITKSSTSKACNATWQTHYRTLPPAEGWAHFCSTHFATVDATISRSTLLGTYQVSGTTLHLQSYAAPTENKLLVTLIQPGLWSSSLEPEDTSFTTVATWVSGRGYHIPAPAPFLHGLPLPTRQYDKGLEDPNPMSLGEAYLVPEKDRLVLEGAINGSWPYTLRTSATSLIPSPAAIKSAELEHLLLTATPSQTETFWPNGKLKQVEPTYAGIIHGIGKYYFDNGQLYGEITYNRGQKQGTHLLYHPDGTLDQYLQYREGKPYGLQAWADDSGHLKQIAFFNDDGETYRRQTTCASSTIPLNPENLFKLSHKDRTNVLFATCKQGRWVPPEETHKP